jgi:hypothetical protein
MSELVHPHKTEVEAMRRAILGAVPGICEGIKWKSPSFRTHEYFATVNLREKNGIGVILHLGAKVKELGPSGISIEDPEGLLKWLAPDRATVRFASAIELQAKKAAAFTSVIRGWVKHV